MLGLHNTDGSQFGQILRQMSSRSGDTGLLIRCGYFLFGRNALKNSQSFSEFTRYMYLLNKIKYRLLQGERDLCFGVVRELHEQKNGSRETMNRHIFKTVLGMSLLYIKKTQVNFYQFKKQIGLCLQLQKKNPEASSISFSMDCFSSRKKSISICFGDHDLH